jgi:hypothetical protein
MNLHIMDEVGCIVVVVIPLLHSLLDWSATCLSPPFARRDKLWIWVVLRQRVWW